jgi:hypothetical protein
VGVFLLVLVPDLLSYCLVVENVETIVTAHLLTLELRIQLVPLSILEGSRRILLASYFIDLFSMTHDPNVVSIEIDLCRLLVFFIREQLLS